MLRCAGVLCCGDVWGPSRPSWEGAGPAALRVGGEGAVSQGHTGRCALSPGNAPAGPEQAPAVLQLRAVYPHVPKAGVSGTADGEAEITPPAEISYEQYVAVTYVSEASQCPTAAPTLERSFGISWTQRTALGGLPGGTSPGAAVGCCPVPCPQERLSAPRHLGSKRWEKLDLVYEMGSHERS